MFDFRMITEKQVRMLLDAAPIQKIFSERRGDNVGSVVYVANKVEPQYIGVVTGYEAAADSYYIQQIVLSIFNVQVEKIGTYVWLPTIEQLISLAYHLLVEQGVSDTVMSISLQVVDGIQRYMRTYGELSGAGQRHTLPDNSISVNEWLVRLYMEYEHNQVWDDTRGWMALQEPRHPEMKEEKP